MTSGMPGTGVMWLGARRMASVVLPPVGILSIVAVRGSWQPMQPVRSPGMTVQKLCIRLTERPCSSIATKKQARSAGISK